MNNFIHTSAGPSTHHTSGHIGTHKKLTNPVPSGQRGPGHPCGRGAAPRSRSTPSRRSPPRGTGPLQACLDIAEPPPFGKRARGHAHLGAAPACRDRSEYLCGRKAAQVRGSTRVQARAARCMHSCLIGRACGLERRRDAGTGGASEGCGSAPELQRHGRRRGSSPQGVDRRPVPPSQPVARLSQAPRSTTRDDPSRARKSFSMPNKPAATTEGRVSFRPICGSLSEVQPRTPSSHLSYPVNSIIERQQPRSPGLHQLLLDGLQPC